MAEPAWSNVILRCTYNSDFADVSDSSATPTTTGDPTIVADAGAYGGGAADFDGNDHVAYSGVPALGTGDFTIQFRLRTDTVANHVAIKIGSTSYALIYVHASNTIRLYAGAVYLSTAFTSGTIRHVALVRDSGSFRLYVNGVNSAGSATPVRNFDAPISIGGPTTAGLNALDGLIDDLRISTEVEYTSDFTPPSGELPTSAPGNQFDGDLPAIQGAFTGRSVALGDFDGEIPAMQGAFTGGAGAGVGTFDGQLPAIQGSFVGQAIGLGDFVGQLPGIQGAFGAYSDLPPSATIHQILLDGVDITNRCSESFTITRLERVAGTAKFTYSPTGTPLFPADLIRKPVVIGWDGEIIFTGKINTAVWDIKTRSFAIDCTDFLQEKFEGQTDATILGLIPGSVYSTAVFGEREDGWQYALDLMSTVQKDVFTDRLGFLQVVEWAAKATPDFTLTGSEILNDGSYALSLAKGRDVITQYNLSYAYRVSRWKRRTHSFSWSMLNHPGASDLCEYWTNWGFLLPTREVVQSAAEGTSWPISGAISYQSLPGAGTYCGGLINRTPLVEEEEKERVTAASWSVIRNWAQTITEKYEIQLSVTAAQATYGIAVHEQAATRQIETDDSTFEGKESNYGSDWPADAIGDRFEDQTDEVARTGDLTALLAVGVTELNSYLRKNTVTVEAAIMPTLELSDTVNINTVDIEAQGKVSKIEHVIDEEKATTRIQISVSNGGAGTGDTIAIPGRPDTAPVHAAPSGNTILPTRVGGCADSAVYDANWDGWATDRDPNTCSTGVEPEPEQFYPHNMRVVSPDIEDESRNDLEATQPVSYVVAVPQDTLTLK